MYKPLPKQLTIQDVKAGDEITANYNLYTYPKTGAGIQSF